jgi:DNA-binding XRE family transcriptional regulator
MNWIKNIRETFGLTQSQLASFIEVNKSSIAMAETGQRLLPTAALLKLNMLELHLQQPRKMATNKIVEQALQKHSSTIIEAINYKTKELAYQIALHKNKVALPALVTSYIRECPSLPLVSCRGLVFDQPTNRR